MARKMLPDSRGEAMIAAMCLLAPWAIGPESGDRGSRLCADGTPIEASLAIGSSGRSELRLVSDPSSGIAVNDVSARRDLVAARCRAFAGSDAAGLIGELAERHIATLPPGAEFLAWLGASASADAPLRRMFYFNPVGTTPDGIDAIVSRWAGAAAAASLRRISHQAAIPFDGIAYDLDGGRICKIQLYFRFSRRRRPNLAEIAGVIDHPDLPRTMRFCAEILPDRTEPAGREHVLGFGVSIGSSEFTPRVYHLLAENGIHRFADLDAVLRRLGRRWAMPLAGPSESAAGFSPTWISMTATAEEERIALYFKPDGFAPGP